MADILIIGCGDVGTRLGHQLAEQGHRVTGLKRQPPVLDDNLHFIAADINDPASLSLLPSSFDVSIFMVSADGRNEASYRSVYESGLSHVQKRLGSAPMIFVSSTSVYGQVQGEWVDEDSAADAENFNGRILRQAEERVIASSPGNIVVRFSGLYGPGRERLLRLAAGVPEIQRQPPFYTNRIHVDDGARALSLLVNARLAEQKLHSIYLASDDDPAPMWDVVSWLATRMHCSQPKIKAAAQDASMNKRCRNDRLKALGFSFKYPSYRDGYAAMPTPLTR